MPVKYSIHTQSLFSTIAAVLALPCLLILSTVGNCSTISGKIIPAGIDVNITAVNSNGEFGDFVHTAADGSYQINNLPAGEYNLSVRAEGYLPNDSLTGIVLTENQTSGDHNLTLIQGGTIKGRISRSGVKTFITVKRPTGEKVYETSNWIYAKNKNDKLEEHRYNEYESDTLPAGKYIVRATSFGYFPSKTNVRVVAGEDTECNISLKRNLVQTWCSRLYPFILIGLLGLAYLLGRLVTVPSTKSRKHATIALIFIVLLSSLLSLFWSDLVKTFNFPLPFLPLLLLTGVILLIVVAFRPTSFERGIKPVARLLVGFSVGFYIPYITTAKLTDIMHPLASYQDVQIWMRHAWSVIFGFICAIIAIYPSRRLLFGIYILFGAIAILGLITGR